MRKIFRLSDRDAFYTRSDVTILDVRKLARGGWLYVMLSRIIKRKLKLTKTLVFRHHHVYVYGSFSADIQRVF